MPAVYIAVLVAILVLGFLAEHNPVIYQMRDGTTEIRPDPVLSGLLFVILIVVSGLRYRVGTDFMAYYRNRVTDWRVVLNSLLTFSEPGIKFLSFIAHAIYDDGQSLIFLSSVIIILLYCCTIYKYHAMFLLSMLLFLLMGEWQSSFNGIRQYLAAGVLFAGHRYILKREFLKYLAVVLAASLFHRSALVMLVPYFLFTRKPDFTQFLILFVGALGIRYSYDIVFWIIESFKGTALPLSDSYFMSNVKLPRILVAFAPTVVYFGFCTKIKSTEEQDFYVNTVFFHAFSMLAGMGSPYLARIGIYSNSFVIIGYGYLFQMIEDEKIRKILIFFVVLLYFAYWFYLTTQTGLRTFTWVFSR